MKLSRCLAVGALVASIAWIFIDQVPDPGFRRGHRGWVSAHTLAVIEKADAEHGFVGNALSVLTPAGRELFYFDRYPVFFSAAMHAVLTATPLSKRDEIHVARQAMNVVHAATLVMAVLLLLQLGLSVEGAVAVTLLGACGYFMVEYRDMVHYDQPALLGVVALMWAIAGWYRGAGNRRVYVVTGVAVLLGRGYASFAVLGVWWLLETVRSIRRGSSARSIFPRVLASVPSHACVLGIALAVACLGYNIAVEARVRGVAVSEVGIVRSAAKRLSLDERFNQRKARSLAWSRFAGGQAENFARGLLPWQRRNPLSRQHLLARGMALSIASAGILFAATRPLPMRTAWLVVACSGPLWLLAMRDLSAFHTYTAIYLFPLSLVCFASLLWLVPPRVHLAVALVACAVFAVSTHGKNRILAKTQMESATETRDLERIAKLLKPGEPVAVHGRLFSGTPFAPGFYFPDHDLQTSGRSSLLLTRDPRLEGSNLTGFNKRIFLIRTPHPLRVSSVIAKRKLGRHLWDRPERTPANQKFRLR